VHRLCFDEPHRVLAIFQSPGLGVALAKDHPTLPEMWTAETIGTAGQQRNNTKASKQQQQQATATMAK